jgi:hypothetical protein
MLGLFTASGVSGLGVKSGTFVTTFFVASELDIRFNVREKLTICFELLQLERNCQYGQGQRDQPRRVPPHVLVQRLQQAVQGKLSSLSASQQVSTQVRRDMAQGNSPSNAKRRSPTSDGALVHGESSLAAACSVF